MVEVNVHDVDLCSLNYGLAEDDLLVPQFLWELVRDVSEDGRVSKPDRDSTSGRLDSYFIQVTIL